MSTRGERRLATVAAVLAVLGVLLALAAMLALEGDPAAAGHPELKDPPGAVALYIVGMASSGTVGLSLAVRRPRHPVGWCFLGLAVLIVLSGLADDYAAHTLIVRPGAGPLGPQVAILSDGIWLGWFAVISAILQLTPTGRPVSRVWGWTLIATELVSWSGYLLKLLQPPRALEAPFEHVTSNPWAWPGAATVLDPLETMLTVSAGLGPVVAAASLLVRYRRARGEERQQLKWLALIVIPLPLLVLVSYAAAMTDHNGLLLAATAGFLVVIPVSAWLSISRYHLYDVDRVLSRAVSWALVSLVLVATYLGVVLLTTTALRGVTNSSELAAALAAVCAAALATPLHRRSQQAVDRRFNRRRFETLRMIKDFVEMAPSGPLVDDVLRRALADSSLQVAYAVQDPESDSRWVDWRGQDVAGRTGSSMDVDRGGRIVARVWFDPAVVDAELVTAAVDVAGAELENVALRAAVALQLEQVRRSRRRIVQAQHTERSRIERDLHDGAQQRLLAVAFDLGTARLRLQHVPATEDVQARLAASVQSLQEAVAELRNLANGLHPAALSGTGLSGALSELAGRTPVPVQVLDATGARRFAEPVEATAWFIALESVTNAVKHAESTRIEIALSCEPGRLTVEIGDDGRGGADPAGRGLRGLADRAEAIGGALAVGARRPRGTLVRAELPCES